MDTTFALLRAFLTDRLELARVNEDRYRNSEVLDAVYWAAFHSGEANAYRIVLEEI